MHLLGQPGERNNAGSMAQNNQLWYSYVLDEKVTFFDTIETVQIGQEFRRSAAIWQLQSEGFARFDRFHAHPNEISILQRLKVNI